MTRTLSILATVLLSIVVTAAAQPQADLQARYKTLSTAVQRQDLAAIASLYVEDASFAVTMPNGHDKVQGVESITGLWHGAIKGGAASFTATMTSTKAAAASVSDAGTFVMKKKDGSVFVQGDYTAEWRKDAGVWKLVRHVLISR